MKTNALIRLLSAALVMGLAVPCALEGQAPAGKGARDLPFFCLTQAWNGPFKVVSTTYDKVGKRVIWVLEARKATRVAKYEAYLSDADGVEIGTVPVRFEPNRDTYKVGTRLHAIISVDRANLDEGPRLEIRERR